MSALERRCRLLLRAYPAEYRLNRGEEIIGTALPLLIVSALAPCLVWRLHRQSARASTPDRVN